MATLDEEPLNKTRSISNSKSTSTPISIVDIAIPENEDLDTHITSRPHSTRSLCSNISLTEPSVTNITPDNDTPLSLKPKKSSKKSSKYYRNLISPGFNPNIEIHAKRRYKLDDGRCGTCQFIGQTSFAKGIWVGIVLEAGVDGNTNGTVYGKKYFQCREGKGLFVRPNKIIQSLGSSSSTFNVTRTRAKSVKKKASNRSNSSIKNTSHKKSISSDATLSMSTSSPLHYTDQHVNFDYFDEDIYTKHDKNHRKTRSLAPTKLPLTKKAKSVQFDEEKKNANTKLFKYRNTTPRPSSPIESGRYRSQSTKQERNQLKKKNKHQINTESPTNKLLDPILPLTPLLDTIPSKSADNSPYITPVPQQFVSDIPLLSTSLLSPEELGSDVDEDCVVLDTFSALRAYFDDHQDILSDGEGYSLRDKLWGSSDDDTSEGARSDSMLDDEDWVNKQHRARQASLAQTLADALTIPALHLVQKKVGTYIGTPGDAWKPPKYDIAPDHSSVLKEKLLHHKKHLDEKWENPMSIKIIKKLGPTEIGRVKGFKLPKYDTVSTPESLTKSKSFLDRDKGWYHKPSRVSQSHMKSMSLDGKKSKSPRKPAKVNFKKKTVHEEKQLETERKIERNRKFIMDTRTEKWRKEHQRSHSELPPKRKKKKVKKKTDKKENEWFESESTWIPRKQTPKKIRSNRKLGPRDIGRSGYKGIKLKADVVKSNNNKKRQSVNKKNKKKKVNKKQDNTPNCISLPPSPRKHKSKPDTPQSVIIKSGISPDDSVSPYPSHFQVSSPLSGEYMTMSIVEDDEDDDNHAFVSEMSYKMKMGIKDAVIFEDTDLDSNQTDIKCSMQQKSQSFPLKEVKSPSKKGKTGKKGNKNRKRPDTKAGRVERSVSLFTGASKKKEKEKRQKAAKNKVRKNLKNKNIVKVSSSEKKGKARKIKKKKIKIWKRNKINSRTPTF